MNLNFKELKEKRLYYKQHRAEIACSSMKNFLLDRTFAIVEDITFGLAMVGSCYAAIYVYANLKLFLAIFM